MSLSLPFLGRDSFAASFIAKTLNCNQLLSAPSLSVEKFEALLASETSQVEEFRFLREMSKTYHYRVWLFGGTAAAYANFMRGKWLKATGHPDFQSPRYDQSSFVNIFRATQDCDIIIDGTAAQARDLEQKLAMNFPYVRGKHSVWEVRLLAEDLVTPGGGKKQALLTAEGAPSSQFICAHNDSQSTGLIEISSRSPGEHLVRDLWGWSSNWTPGKMPRFLSDVLAGKLTYYLTSWHHLTARAVKGKNPPLLSAIRALKKSFQYDLRLEKNSRQNLVAVVESTVPALELQHPYVQKWLKWSATQLFQSATDYESAVQLMDSLGLRKLLISIGDPTEVDSFAWWLSREPLRSFPLGLREGGSDVKTAAELEIDVVSHWIDAQRYIDYETLLWTKPGQANVLVEEGGSVKGYPVEEGWGAVDHEVLDRELGIRVAFQLHPLAREGVDFLRDSDHLVILNKNAIHTLPESLKWDPLIYFENLQQQTLKKIHPGILARIRRHVLDQSGQLTEQQADQLLQIFRLGLKSSRSVSPLFFPDMIQMLGARLSADEVRILLSNSMVSEPILFALAKYCLSDPRWSKDPSGPRLIRKAIEIRHIPRGTSLRRIAKDVLSQEVWARHPRGLELFMALVHRKDSRANHAIIEYLLDKDYWNEIPVVAEIKKNLRQK